MASKTLFVICEGSLTSPAAPHDRPVPPAGAFDALLRLSRAGYAIVLLQERPAEQADSFDYLRQLLVSQGIAAGAVLRCTHDSGCDCAPPGLGLVREYIAGDSLDRTASAVVGASGESATLAANMGLKHFPLDSDNTWADVAHALLDAPRTARVRRSTKETDIEVSVDLDRQADARVSTGIGFFDHMLEQLGKHGGFELKVECKGDLEVDEHHTIEDVALAAGEALRAALGAKRGVARYGFLLPMDEASAEIALDLSGRPYFVFEGEFTREMVGGMPTELVPHFFRSLSEAMRATLHIGVRGDNDHHKVEAMFKGVAKALQQAMRRDGDDLPSTKGAL